MGRKGQHVNACCHKHTERRAREGEREGGENAA